MGVADGVEGEVLVKIHVIIVVPYHVEWDFGLFVVLNNIFDYR